MTKMGFYTAVIVRAADATPNRFYQGYVAGANSYGIAVYWDGVWVPLASAGSVTWQAGDTLRLEATGSASPVTLTLYCNGSPVLATSTSVYVIDGGNPGLGLASSGGQGLTLDDWEGGNL